MQKLVILVVSSFLLISNVICMELEKKTKKDTQYCIALQEVEKKLRAELDRVRITLYKDIILEERFEPSIGKIVAYEIPNTSTNNDTIKVLGNNRIKLAYHSSSNPSVYYAYVEDKKFYDRSSELSYRWSRQQNCLVKQLDRFDNEFLLASDNKYIMHALLKTYSCMRQNKDCSDYKGMWYCCSSQFQNLCPEPSHLIHYGFLGVNITMREITFKEVADILEVLKAKRARFTYWVREEFSLPKILAYLNERLKNKK